VSTEAGEAYAPGSIYGADANLTLYAIWKQNAVTGTGIPGDIDADGQVNNRDLIALRLYMDQKASQPLEVREIPVVPEALDVDGNGVSAEASDFDALMKYLSGWDITLHYGTGGEGEPELPVSFSVTHPDHGDLIRAGTVEVYNGYAHMTWTVSSSHSWEAEITRDWCYFDTARTEQVTSGPAGTGTLRIYLDDSKTNAMRSCKVRFTVDGEVFVVELRQEKARISISHPDYPDVVWGQPIHLFNNANISMTWTVESTHDWSAEILEASSDWVTVRKISDTKLRLTTLWYAAESTTNRATVAIYVNGDVYEIEIYQN
jgi:hypothetical protein